ncbi:MAG: hypothetical protein KatS3mg119_0607 [Rhodothalassiaceae bacterium]|nr:MAG: hypothetical protein KatS3mg119_0607 [Rhodothalassiaceae bacterium]
MTERRSDDPQMEGLDIMATSPTFSQAADLLQKLGLRSTRARLWLLHLLIREGADGDALSASALRARAKESGVPLALATVYNTLNRLASVGALIVSRGAQGVVRYRLHPDLMPR